MILILVALTVLASYLLILWVMGKSTVSPSPKAKNKIIIWIASVMIFIAGATFGFFPAILTSIALPFIPFVFLWQKKRQRQQSMNNQMDNMLANLANAFSVTGNLSNAIEDVADGEPEPMQSELTRVLHEIRLGSSEDDALQRMAERSELPLFRTAITAMIVGKRSGGQLAQIMSDTAASIRELKRLDGVLKTKTAEGRIQAWVMGLVPFFLCGLLQLINPDWLAPLWNTPFGWVLLSCALLLEIIAVLLIRKILAVAL